MSDGVKVFTPGKRALRMTDAPASQVGRRIAGLID